ncbi:MAG: DJ-1/PfpI family protein [Treponema sp.]|nr:DJ-1/PfpI family protein [Treponema sp.]
MTKKALVLLAQGFEEVEAVTPIDYLRRAGLDVTAAAVGETRLVTGSHGISIQADTTLAELAEKAGGISRLCLSLDALLLPGGLPGAPNLAASGDVTALTGAMVRGGKITAAICASPALVLAPLGLLEGRRFTCYPGMEKDIAGGFWSEEPVVIDGKLITSRGAGTAASFAVAIIGELLGEAAGRNIARSVLLPQAAGL